jgi:hypothetical protein
MPDGAMALAQALLYLLECAIVINRDVLRSGVAMGMKKAAA